MPNHPKKKKEIKIEENKINKVVLELSEINIREHPKVYNLYLSGPIDQPKLFTKNYIPEKKIYGERLYTYNGVEFREWDPHRSKLAAILVNNPNIEVIRKGDRYLYLGAASGTTVSHLSDILRRGIIFSIEFAERSIRQLIQNTAERKNVIPIFGDARFPAEYGKFVFSEVDVIYQDVAQPNQAEIAIKNCNYYLKEDGLLVLAIKSQSIDSISKSETVYKQEKQKLEDAGYFIEEDINIHKYAANHIVLIARKR
ncbi:MAG: fibrillarin-like rRNA/tRNA 2'-O-methyltransferase [Candidatus Lokiarchaeota archaeon]|nr:fibrillarin-like rRNA/tRNA 2'-O-methyltransferase [Candidatus Lokiarchaeota archaeon]MBD3202230.1 fibrillarin-like rRNA/tRNA 2'-O-methyltransferase [Candidatus Lokiarchaeota archaeon]